MAIHKGAPDYENVPYVDAEVIVLARVESDGSISDAEMISGPKPFEAYAIAFVRRMQFRTNTSQKGPWSISVSGQFRKRGPRGFPMMGFAQTGKEIRLFPVIPSTGPIGK